MASEKNELSPETRNSKQTVVGPEADLKSLLEQNLALSQEILAMSSYIKSYIRWQKIFGWVKVLVVAVPIILGIIYLPSALKSVLSSYGLDAETSPYTNLLK